MSPVDLFLNSFGIDKAFSIKNKSKRKPSSDIAISSQSTAAVEILEDRTLLDASSPDVTLAADVNEISEYWKTPTFTATLNEISVEDVTVNLGFSGTATKGIDYGAWQEFIEIKAGDLSGQVKIQSIPDYQIEGDESIIIDVTSVINGTESGEQSVTINLNDDETPDPVSGPIPDVTLSSDVSEIGEYWQVPTFTATLSETSTEDVLVNLEFKGTATNGEDYGAWKSYIRIPAGELSADIKIQSIPDNIVEGDETIRAVVTSVVNAKEKDGNQSTTVILRDDNYTGLHPEVTLTPERTVFGEYWKIPTISAKLSEVSQFDTIINLDFSGTATEGVDYGVWNKQIVIPAGKLAGHVQIQSIPDSQLEFTETIIVDISSIVNGIEKDGDQSALLRLVNSNRRGITTRGELDLPPLLDQIGPKFINTGEKLSFKATAKDYNLPTNMLTFSLGEGAPASATIHSETGVFCWTPTEADDSTTYMINVRVTDDTGLSDFEKVMITVGELNQPPVLVPIGPKSVDEGKKLSFTVTASDNDLPDDTLTFTLDTDAPSGASIHSETGLFNWTPTEADGPGTFDMTIRVRDSFGETDYEKITVTVNDLNQPPVLNPIGPKTIDEGNELNFTVTATDNDFPVNTLMYTLDSGAPSGATINPNSGLFNWTPDESDGPNTYEVTVRVTDNTGLSDFETITITVNEDNQSPILDLIRSKTIDIGNELSFIAAASDNDIPTNTLTFSLDSGAPLGASINPDTGLFSWTPDETIVPGNYEISFRVTDNYGGSDFQNVNITVGESLLFLSERNQFVSEKTTPVELGQETGTRKIRIGIESFFDTFDQEPTVDDIFLIYLVDKDDPSQTLLDRGTPGTSLFSLSNGKAEYLPGIVSFDGSTVEIDVTGINSVSVGLLKFQLINSDGDEESFSRIISLENLTDPDGSGASAFKSSQMISEPGSSLDLSALEVSDNVKPIIENIRFDSITGQYTADISVLNEGPDQGRQIVVIFDELPGNVTLVNASGVDSSGNPYINFQPSIPSGGLTQNSSSKPIQVTFLNPDLERFKIVPRVLTGGENQAPVISPIGPLSVMPGEQLKVPIMTTDPDGDQVSLFLRTQDRLPNAVLNNDGTLVFTPSPEHVGTYSFSIVASDGVLETVEEITLEVLSDTLSTTRISGVVLDTNSEPLEGVPIELGRYQTITGSDGTFVIELPASEIPTEDFSILIPQGDPYFDPFNTGTATINVERSRYDQSTGTDTSNPRQHPNLVSSYIDGSAVYGSDQERASALRTNDGTGKLKTSTGDYLPINNETYFADGPLENVNRSSNDPSTLFVAGDVRASENVALASLHTIFVREHNRLADEIKLAEPTLNGEEIFQRARKLVIAQIQHITYQEFLPILLGQGLSTYSGYDSSVDSSISNFFSTVAFRFGHSQANEEILRVDENGQEITNGHLSLNESTFNTDPILTDGIDPILLGLIAQSAQTIDTKVIDELRNLLFGPPGAGGIDLTAVNIQRGRDHGLPDYNQARVDFGLAPVTTFAEITSDVALQNALENTYGSVDNIDPWVGGLAEDHFNGGILGELFLTVIKEQFERLRDGDRFWYENSQFTSDELSGIQSTSLATLIERNTGISNLTGNLFTTGTAPTGPTAGGAAAGSMVNDYRSFDGTGNNLLNSEQGSAGTNLIRKTTVDYGDGISTPSGNDRPDSRTISNNIFSQSGSIPDPAGTTAMLAFWGQFLAHEIDFTPEGIADTIKIHGDERVGEKSYPFVAENIELLLEHEVYPNTNNMIIRPIYLPALDLEQAVTINPSQDTIVTAQLLEDTAPAEVFVEAGTLKDKQGNLFTGDLSITQVPAILTPAALPENLFPDIVVTIQPAEMVFSTPAPLSLPSVAGYAPGTLMDLWSINPVTGEFEIVGKGQVNEDGTLVETIEGGIRNSSWHTFTPPPPPVLGNPDDNSRNQDIICEECVAKVKSNSEVELHSGALLEMHDLLTYQSAGEIRGVTLHYDSLRADARPIIHFGFDESNLFYGDTMFAELTVEANGVKYKLPGYQREPADNNPNTPNDLRPEGHYWEIDTNGDFEGAVQFDLSELPTGIYDYKLKAGIGNVGLQTAGGAGVVATSWYGFRGAVGTFESQIYHVNPLDNPFGKGWNIAGIQSIVEEEDGSVLLLDGNGSELYFKKDETGLISPPGDFSKLEKFFNGTYQRTMQDQTVYQFNSDGQIISMTDRNQLVTSYVYDPNGNLIKIVDPVGLETLFGYTNGQVTSITDPAGRTTTLNYDDAGNLVGIEDPDQSKRTFEYDDKHHLVSEIDKRGNQEWTFYDFAGRVTGSQLKDGSLLYFDPVQTQFLLPPTETIDPNNPPPAFRSTEQIFGNMIDSNGNLIRTQLDQAGQAVKEQDEEGVLYEIIRDENNRIVSITDGRGYEESFEYDEQGRITTESNPYTSAGTLGDLFPQTEIKVGDGAFQVKTADLNNDGYSDIISLNKGPSRNETQGSIGVALGKGNGTFSDADEFDFNPAFNIKEFELTDYNYDGNLDVIILGEQSNLYVMLGDGAGNFNLEETINLRQRTGLSTFIRSFDLADMNNDGLTDMVIRISEYDSDNASYYNVGILYSTEEENFSTLSFVDLLSSSSIESLLKVGDLNKDGFNDIIISKGSSTILLFGDENDEYTRRETLAYSGSTPFEAVDVSDINNDGLLDIVAIHKNDRVISSFMQKPDETFLTGVITSTSFYPKAIQLAELNDDGFTDVVIVSNNPNYIPDRNIFSLLGSGDGSFTVLQSTNVGEEPSDIALADFNEDGNIDFVSSNSTQSSGYQLRVGSVSVRLGMGTGEFDNGSIIVSGTYSALDSAIADFNNDGILDIASAQDKRNNFVLYIGNQDGSYTLSETEYSYKPWKIYTEDFNNDGLPDLVVTSTGGSYSPPQTIFVFLNTGDPENVFETSTQYNIGGSPDSLQIADFDNDGYLDLAVTARIDGKFRMLWGSESGTFEVSSPINIGRFPSALSHADYDGDGDLDVMVIENYLTLNDTRLNFMENEGNRVFRISLDLQTPDVDPTAISMESVDLNHDGHVDLIVSGYDDDLVIKFLMGDGTGSYTEYDAGISDILEITGMFKLTDLDEDGNHDLIVAREDGAFYLYKGLGDGSFQYSSLVNLSYVLGRSTININDLEAHDFNNDGAKEIFVQHNHTSISYQNGFTIYSNQLGDPEVRAEYLNRGIPEDYQYDPIFSQLTQEVDELGHQTLYEIDPNNGNTLSITKVIGLPDATSNQTDDIITSFTYTGLGLVDIVTDPLGRQTDFDYDQYGRVTSIIYALGTLDEATEYFEYDLAGNLTAFTDGNGNRTRYEFDKMNRILQMTEADPDGVGPLDSPVTRFAYDDNGNLIQTIDASQSTTNFTFDSLNRVVLETDANGKQTQYRYDNVGNVIEITDPLGQSIQYRYDKRYRLISMIDPEGGMTDYEYDGDNNLIALTDPERNRTEFIYDKLNRLVLETDPLGNEISYLYDAVDNLKEVTDRNGRMTKYSYDELDRLLSEIWVSPDMSTIVNEVDYTYDAASNLLSASDNFSSISYTYDFRDRIASVDNLGTPDVPNVVLNYEYDDVGNVVSMTDSIDSVPGATTSYVYDALNRMTQITQNGSGVSDKRVDIEYNPVGQFASINRYSDLGGTELVVGTSYNYDVLNRLTSLYHNNSSETVAFYDFTYNADSLITQIIDTDGTTDYTYDLTDQLVTADHTDSANPDESYDYDENGNRIDSHLHGTEYVTGPGNRLISDGTYNYDYDNEGNMTRRTEIATGDYRIFVWDHRNRLVAINDFQSDDTPIQTIEFSYDVFNRRISKAVDETPTDGIDAFFSNYVYDGIDVLFDFKDSDGSGPNDPELDQRYLHGPAIDQVLAQEDGAGNVEWLLHDHLGTTRDIVNETGIVINHIKYDSFGNVIEQSGETVETRYLFTGREYDPETGLFYYRARYYDPELGRFISEDPIGFGGGDQNLYRYVLNNPLTLLDPLGLDAWEINLIHSSLRVQTTNGLRQIDYAPASISDGLLGRGKVRIRYVTPNSEPLGFRVRTRKLTLEEGDRILTRAFEIQKLANQGEYLYGVFDTGTTLYLHGLGGALQLKDKRIRNCIGFVGDLLD